MYLENSFGTVNYWRTAIRTVFFALPLVFAGNSPALGSPLDLSYTHYTALTVPKLSVTDTFFKIAKT